MIDPIGNAQMKLDSFMLCLSIIRLKVKITNGWLNHSNMFIPQDFCKLRKLSL